MRRLNLPQQLKGPWDSLLILTYGAQLAFYENALGRVVADRCRNRVILCDDAHYRSTCEQLLQSPGLLRSLNHRYLFAGIRCPRGVAHAKCVLLLNSEEGRLLVGSGNLGLRGYALNEELFSTWSYTAEKPNHLSEFVAVKSLVDGLSRDEWFLPEAAHQIDVMWERAPWLLARQTTEDARVRTNWERPFLEQLELLIAGEQVEELMVLSAFYDEHVEALRRVLQSLNPLQCTVYVQPRHTSVDAGALDTVLSGWGGDSQVLQFTTAGKHKPYCHAKLVLAKTGTRSICLQGSPNMSQSAMLLPARLGNLETANLLEGDRDAFDHVLEALRSSKVATDVSKIDVTYNTVDEVDRTAESAWVVRSAAFEGIQLVAHSSGEPPFASLLAVRAQDVDVPIQGATVRDRSVIIPVDAELLGFLEKPVALRLVWTDAGNEERVSNPFVPCNLARLATEINASAVSRSAHSFGELDLDDDEIEALLVEMSTGLLQDKADVFRVAGSRERLRGEELTEGADDRDLIDWDAVRATLRYKQYLAGKGVGVRSGVSLLSALLGSINSQFRGLTTTGDTMAEGVHPPELLLDYVELPEDEGSVEEQASSESEALREHEQQAAERRLWATLVRFIDRFVDGTFDPLFVSNMGPLVVIRNYRVILHLLTLLLDRSVVRSEFDAEYLVQKTQKVVAGLLDEYIPGLESGMRAEAAELIRAETVSAGTLVALALIAEVADRPGDEALARSTREVVRSALNSGLLDFDTAVGEEIAAAASNVTRTKQRTLMSMIAALSAAANWLPNSELRGEVARVMEVPSSSLIFDDTHAFGEGVERTRRLLVGMPVQRLDMRQVVSGLEVWTRARDADVYRFSVGDSRFEGMRPGAQWIYDASTSALNESRTGEQRIQIKPKASEWDLRLARLQSPTEVV